MAGYSARQSTYVTGDTIEAADSNDEFTVILAAFHATTGHKHDGTTSGDGAKLVVLGAVNSGSITSGFGTIDNGTSNITTGGILALDVDGGAAAAGALVLGVGSDASVFFDGTNLNILTDGAGASGIILDSEDDTFEFKGSGTLQITMDTDGIDLASGDAYYINNTSVLNATTLGSAVITSSLTAVGALNSGSITSGFTSIDVGSGAVTTTGAISGGTLTLTGQQFSSLTNTITAGSTQSQAGATALTKDINRVTVSGTDGDGVKLPTAVAGSIITIINDDSAQTIKVWPNTDDAIDGGSANAVDANTLAFGSSREYFAVDATNWYTMMNSSLATPVSVASGGTGATSLTDGGVLLGSGTGAVTAMSALADGNIIIGDGSTDPVALAAFSSSTGTLKVANGGTGASTLTDGGVLLGSGTNAVTATAVLADGEMLVGDGSTDPAIESGDTLRTSIMGAIGPDLNTLGAVSSNSEFIVGTGAGAFAYESGTTLRTSVGVGTTDSPTFTGLTLSGFEYLSMTTGITAGTTQSQAGATALTTQTNRVTVSGTDADAVKLPTAVANALVTIINDDAAQTIAVWPNTGDTIDGGSANAVDSNTLAAGNSRTYLAYDATNWVTVTNAPSVAFNPDAAVVFNDSGNDADFRIESQSNANAFLLDSALGVFSWGGAANNSVLQFHQATHTFAGTNALAHFYSDTVTLFNANATYDHMKIAGGVTTPGDTKTISVLANLHVADPNITVGSGDTVTEAISTYISSAPTEGTGNAYLKIGTGTMPRDYGLFVSENLDAHFGDRVHIGSENANHGGMGYGLMIDQGGGDSAYIVAKSSDVAHGLTGSLSNWTVQTDDIMHMGKQSGATGGLIIDSFSESALGNPLTIRAWGGGTAMADAVAYNSSCSITMVYHGHDDANGFEALKANGNVFGVLGRPISSASRLLFIVDEDGDLFSDSSATVGTFDQYDDIAMMAQFDLTRTTEFQPLNKHMMSPSRFDGNAYTLEHYQGVKMLGDAGVFHKRDEDGELILDEDGDPIEGTKEEAIAANHNPHVGLTASMRMNAGAWRQAHQLFDCIIRCLDDRDPGYKAALREHLVHCDLPTQIIDWEGTHEDSPLHDIVDPGPIPPDRGVAPPPPAFNE